ncbi:helix-turn-helix domain-containing protein [Kiloniella laminariae]|uniref:Helix-turn-helix domain-containing protein n=1 Tax=Kiloniella laminariae TaxID=454162 RepID=A0ABT4LJB9_9PROT|nr:helix-turn-helix domain-containing protein [Kiloniella laminariae]MCZ4281200.1 helix-turn-helix domain-containing protein [Kiloniella laminariae]
MTPFGQKLREIRAQRQLTMKEMAKGLGVSSAYLSSVEHGHRGQPSRRFVHRVCQYLNIIWDDAEELEELAIRSDPKVSVNTAGLTPKATYLANCLAEKIAGLSDEQIEAMMKIMGVDDDFLPEDNGK